MKEEESKPSESIFLDAFNPIDCQFYKVTVRGTKADWVRQIGVGATKVLHEIVPPTLRNPTAVFRGLRDRDAANWLCYVGLPARAYDYETGNRVPPWENEVFLVFVNDNRVVYSWRWEKSDPCDPRLPKGHESRFDRRLEYPYGRET